MNQQFEDNKSEKESSVAAVVFGLVRRRERTGLLDGERELVCLRPLPGRECILVGFCCCC